MSPQLSAHLVQFLNLAEDNLTDRPTWQRAVDVAVNMDEAARHWRFWLPKPRLLLITERGLRVAYSTSTRELRIDVRPDSAVVSRAMAPHWETLSAASYVHSTVLEDIRWLLRNGRGLYGME